MWHLAANRTAFRVTTTRPGGERPVEGSRRRWEDNASSNVSRLGVAADRERRRALVTVVMGSEAPLSE